MATTQLTRSLKNSARNALLLFKRNAATTSTFKFADIDVKLCHPEEMNAKPNIESLVPGATFTDHMLQASWSIEEEWTRPSIVPIHDIELHPAAKVFHYAIEVSEGMRAFRGIDGRTRLFRPEIYIQRLIDTTHLVALPKFDREEFLNCLVQLLQIERGWVPSPITSSLFIQTNMIGTEATVGIGYSKEAMLYTIMNPCGPSFHNGFRPISVVADAHNIRSWPCGVGATRLGSAYAPTIQVLKEARDKGFDQILWLFGKEGQCTQLGDLNVFFDLVDSSGERQLVTPPLSDLILAGVTRQSLLELVRQWGQWDVVERHIDIHQLLEAHRERRLLGFFAVGNSGQLTPVSDLTFNGRTYAIQTMDNTLELIEKFVQIMADIQHGKIDHPWALPID